jgi:PAS domain S-box-containing protein
MSLSCGLRAEPDTAMSKFATSVAGSADDRALRSLQRVERERDTLISVLSFISDFAYVFDLQGRFRYANQPLLDLWGLTLEQAVGKNFFDLKYPEPLAARLQQQIQQVIDTRSRIVDETEYISPEGVAGFYEYIFSPVIAADGTVEAVAGSTRIITQRKHLEAAIQRAAVDALAAAEANAKFRTFFEQGSYFAGVLTLDGTVVEANRLCIDACGFTRDQVIGKKFWECGWWNGDPQLTDLVRSGVDVARHGETFRRESKYYVADGTQRMVDLMIAPVKDESGRVLFLAPTGVDITERKRIEQELRDSEHRFRDLADKREQLLASERAARAEADAANRAKDRFLAVLSHELRTPLSPVVMTVAEMEIDPEMPGKFRNELAMIRRNIELETKLIDDLLDLSRVTSGKLRLQMQPVAVHELLNHVLQSSAGDLAEKQLNVCAELNATHDAVMADPARLQQVYWNLLRNAAKFTPVNGKITVRTWNDNGQLIVSVQDTGVGITPEALPRIFGAFEQADTSITRQFGGLGLGLAIAKAVVDMHGGQISAASEGQDRGATFNVRFNTIDAPVNAEPVIPPRKSTSLPGMKPRILLVEDHPDTARTMARLLKHLGYDVKTANSAATALQLTDDNPFDVIISDIGLPDATGYELMKQLRERHGLTGIALSGYGMEDDMRQSREAGFLEHVVKPVNLTQLDAVIRRIVTAV